MTSSPPDPKSAPEKSAPSTANAQESAPTPAANPFADLPAPISAALVARGFTQLTAVQQAVLRAEFAGRDLRISSQTGSGKTVAIGLALAQELESVSAGRAGAGVRDGKARGHAKPASNAAAPVALVIVPTRELARSTRRVGVALFESEEGSRRGRHGGGRRS